MNARKALIFTMAFVLVGLLVAGCGGNGGGGKTSEAKQILDKALNNLKTLKSVKVTMKSSSASSTSAPSSGSSAVIEVTTEGGLAMHTVMDYGGTKMEQYQIGDVAYAFQEGQGWLKQQASGTKPINVEIADSLKTGLKDLKILSQDAGSYRLSFKMATPDSSAQDSSSSSSTATSGDTEFVVKVDKPDMNIQEISVKASKASSSGGQAQEEVITFSDLNSPITITLPEEAKSAKSTEELQQSAPDSSGL